MERAAVERQQGVEDVVQRYQRTVYRMISTVNCRPLNGFLFFRFIISPLQHPAVITQAEQGSKLQ
jgi:hypothetical protein